MPHLDDRPADDALIASLLAKVQSSLSAHGIAFETHPEDTDVVRLLEAQALKGDELSFYYVNLAAIVRKYEEWVRWLPRVRPFYAVKCNPDAVVVRCLNTIGTGYDCASIGEMQQILDLGVAPERIIYANPCKQKSGIEFARDHQILRMTFDNIAELRKIYSIYPEAELVIRIKPPTEQSVMSFSRKFGASTASAISLVNEAAKLGAKIVGVSFHVGSGCYDVSAYTMTLDQARKVFDAAESVGMKMTLLDIGGGFPGTDGNDGSLDIPPISFPEIAATVGPYIDKLFPESVTVISEPGRYFVAESTVLCASVLGRRNRYEESDQASAESSPIASEESQFLYYIADGIYGSFNATIFDHMVVRPHVLPATHRLPLSQTHTSTCFGPTCDSMDVVCRNIVIPELEIGDWLYFHNMGAYTRASGSTFNGIPLPVVHYYIS